MANDVPEQYKDLNDRVATTLADAGDSIYPILGELGCDRFECEGKFVTVIVVVK